MKSQNFFLLSAYHNIKHNLPEYVLNSIKRLIPIYLISSIFEIFGLVVIFPVIRVIVEPAYIKENKYLQFIYTTFHFEENITFVLFLFTSITIIFLLKNTILFFISRRQTSIAYDLSSKLGLDKYNSYLNKPYKFHVENNTAILLRNFAQLPFDLIGYLILPFIAIINELFILFLIILAITLYEPQLFLSLVVFTTPFLFIYNKVYKKRLKEISNRRDKESANMYKTGLQSMEAFREIVIFNKKNYFKPIFKRTLDSYSKTTGEIYLLNLFSPKIVETVAILGIFSIFISGYIFQKDIALLAQFLIVFSIAAYRVIPSLNKIILCSNLIKSSMYIFNHFDNTEEKEKAKENTVTTSSQPIEFKEKIEIKDLSFQFPGINKQVLNSINLTIKKGQTIGIVGPSGGGKTTFLNILLRLYQETEGGIFIDGQKIQQDNVRSWYELLSYVPQNITLLDTSIVGNIAFGIDDDKVDYDLLKKVILQAQLDDFISELKDGIHTQIGEKGIKISGGQRQRIGIARALYHGGKILVFDEATSSLDNETERMLTESINNISHKEFTIIIVAHRIQTLKYCDTIYKLENGFLYKENN
jgi:ATP-binding cassette, subfamily B, bacterial PglK